MVGGPDQRLGLGVTDLPVCGVLFDRAETTRSGLLSEPFVQVAPLVNDGGVVVLQRLPVLATAPGGLEYFSEARVVRGSPGSPFRPLHVGSCQDSRREKRQAGGRFLALPAPPALAAVDDWCVRVPMPREGGAHCGAELFDLVFAPKGDQLCFVDEEKDRIIPAVLAEELTGQAILPPFECSPVARRLIAGPRSHRSPP